MEEWLVNQKDERQKVRSEYNPLLACWLDRRSASLTLSIDICTRRDSLPSACLSPHYRHAYTRATYV